MTIDPQLAVSLLTLIATPALSAAVVAYQLSRGHVYWAKEQEILQSRELYKLRADLLRRTASLLSEATDRSINHHVFTSSRDIASVLAIQLQKSNRAAAPEMQEQFAAFREKVAQSYVEARKLSLQITELAAESLAYLDDSVSKSLVEFRTRFNAALDPGYDISHVKDIVERLFADSDNLDRVCSAAGRQLDQLRDSQIARLDPTEVLQKMVQSVRTHKPQP
jgi:hypothetical protein